MLCFLSVPLKSWLLAIFLKLRDDEPLLYVFKGGMSYNLREFSVPKP